MITVREDYINKINDDLTNKDTATRLHRFILAVGLLLGRVNEFNDMDINDVLSEIYAYIEKKENEN